VIALGKRIATAQYNGQRIQNALTFDGAMDEFIPPSVGVFIRGNVKSAKAAPVTSANNLLTTTIPVTPRVAALRGKLRLPPVRAMTFQQLRDSVANRCSLV
jgi:hypothetical protein